jgi:hypothetical protein
MARLIPTILPSEIRNSGERKLAVVLVQQLPSRVEVYHSFQWMTEGPNGVAHQGECDFVIVDPEQGILFVEVKGGELRSDPTSGSWYRVHSDGSREVLKRSPFNQVLGSMHAIVERIREALARPGADLPFVYGCAVALPDCVWAGQPPAELRPEMIWDANKCRDLRKHVDAVLEMYRRGSPEPMSPRELEAVRVALVPRYEVLPVMWRKVEDQELKMRRMTEEQHSLLKFLSRQHIAAIEGVAGSGKTLLALAKAQEMARQGRRTLLLCYNKPLMEWLRQVADCQDAKHLVIDTYHGIGVDLTFKAGIRGDRNSPDYYDRELPELLMTACGILADDHKFDAVIVDEGQDFHELWWISMESLFRVPKEERCFYVFYDPRQNIYTTRLQIPAEFGSAFPLTRNCRNTKRIAEHCAALVGVDQDHLETATDGDEPVFRQTTSLGEALAMAGKQIREWCMPLAVNGGLRPSQVALLHPPGRISEKLWPFRGDSLKGTTDHGRWRKNEGVLVESWERFKGLEADAIVIVDDRSGDDAETRMTRYVARSRAKHVLVVIEVRPN